MISKKIKYALSFLCALIALSCTTRDDEFKIPEGSTAVPFIVTSIVESPGRELRSRVGFDVTLLDSSIGTTDGRQWIIPENAASIMSGKSDDKKIIIRFLTAGTHDIGLKSNSSVGPVETSISIIVLEKTVANFTAAPVDPAAQGFSFNAVTKEITVESGTEVQFTSTVEGGLDDFDWKFPGQAPTFSEIADPIITFKQLGESGYNFRAQSTSPFGDVRLPFYANNTAETFYTVTVVPSSLPLLANLNEVSEQEDETIQIPFNQQLDPFTGQESTFTVTVNGTPFTIASVSLNADDSSIVEIRLNDPIYRPDVITVSYDGTGTLQTNGNNAEAFSDATVNMHNVNLWNDAIYGFEQVGWTETDGNGTLEYSTEQAFEGASSLKYTTVAGEGFTRGSGGDFTAELEGGKTYTITYSIWIDPSTTTDSWGPWFYWTGGNQQFWTGTAGRPKGEWLTISRDQLVTDTGPAYMTLRISGDAIIYVDDFHIVETEVRP